MVAGIDNDPSMVALAGARAAEASLHNIDIRVADVRQPPVATLSLGAVVGRLIVIHLTSPATDLAALTRLLRPGGMLLMMDLGLRLPALFREAGLDDVGVMTVTPASGDTGLAAAYVSQTVRSLWPIIARTRPDAASDYDADAAAERLERELSLGRAKAYFPELVGVWSANGPAHRKR